MTIDTNMYAIALYEASLSTSPQAYMDELDQFITMLDENSEIETFFYKTYDNFDKVKDILSEGFSKEFINFLAILYKSRSLRSIRNIASKFESLLMENDLLSIVKIYSSTEVSENVKNKLINMISGKYPEPFRITTFVDGTLLGGYIVKVNGDIYDTSLRSKLNHIKNLEV